MPDGTEGIVVTDNTETQTPIDVVKLQTDLNAANLALTEKEKQYKGLQTTYNALHESSKTLEIEKSTLSDEMVTLKNQMEQAAKDGGNFETQFNELNEKYEALQGDYAKLETSGKRKDLILDDYPELLQFEQKGLLPEFDGDEDAFKAKLDTFKETLGTQTQEAVDDELDGAGPDLTDGDNTAPDREKVMDEMLRIAGDPNKAQRYRELQTKLDEIDEKAAK